MSNPSKFYRVEFVEPKDGQTVFNFVSLSAIFNRFSKADVGCCVKRLWNVKPETGKPFKNSRCTISKELVFHKQKKGGV